MASRPDVIVIGGGIVGCAVASELAQRGASVELIEERAIGMGATQASAGILAPYIEAREDSPLFDLTIRSLDLFDDFVASVTADSGLSVAYRRTGTLDVATDESGLSALRDSAEMLARHGVPADLVDGAAARHEEPQLSDEVAGGLVIPSHGFVSATELTRAAAAAARHRGVRLVEHNRCSGIEASNGHVAIDTAKGTIEANAVVLAAGSWSGSIAVAGVTEPVPVRPVRGQLLHLSWTGPRLRRVIFSPRCYLVPWDDGTVLVGATMEMAGFDERTTVAGVRDLLDAACDIAPHAWAAGFIGARVGLRPGTADDLPMIGWSRSVPHLMYATGHFRNGVLLAPLTARLVADAILEERLDPALESLSPARFGAL